MIQLFPDSIGLPKCAARIHATPVVLRYPPIK